MGAFIIMDIIFKREEDRKKFEKKYSPKILVDENANSEGFCAWTWHRDPSQNPIYFMGFRGYAEPEEILKECKKEKIKIKSFSWIPINDKNSNWEKLK